MNQLAQHSRLRPETEVLAPERCLAAVPTALSFSRSTVDQLVAQRWRLRRLRFDLDAGGVGSALYRLEHEDWTFHFLVVSKDFPADQKTDRSFGENWDISAVLCQGDWTRARERVLLVETPKQRAGRFDYDTLVTLRGNRSGRVFDHVVESLAGGRVPDIGRLAEAGYIVRTTGLIANGALGMRPFAGLGADHPFAQPYAVQIVASLLLREFVAELVDAMAAARSANAIALPASFRRYLGLGNAAGAGLAAYVAANPMTIHRWVHAGETAIEWAWATEIAAGSAIAKRLAALLDRAIAHYEEEGLTGNGIFSASDEVVAGLRRLQPMIAAQTNDGLDAAEFSSHLRQLVDELEPAAREVAHAIMVELLPARSLAALRGTMTAPSLPALDYLQPAEVFRNLLRTRLGWALGLDFARPEATWHFWYRSSAAPLDPRMGRRGSDPGDQFEWRMDLGWRAARLEQILSGLPATTTMAEVVAAHPDLRDAIRRVQALRHCSYGEVIRNRLAADYTPFADMRLKLGFYGMSRLHPALPKSVRGAFLQGAPTMADIERGQVGGAWPFPLRPAPDDIAPLPATPWAEESVPEGDATDDQDRTRCSPVEIGRLVTRALHGRGLSLGVADVVADAILLAETSLGGGLKQLADLLSLQRIRPILLGADEIAAGWTARADGVSALAFGPSPVELACARATASGIGEFSAEGALVSELMTAFLPLAGLAGCTAMLVWTSRDDNGLAVFVPADAGESGGLVSVAGLNPADHADRMSKLLSHPGFADVPDALTLAECGFKVIAVRAKAMPDLWWHSVRAGGAGARVLTLADLTAQSEMAMNAGLRLPPEVRTVLDQAGRAVLIPAGPASGDNPETDPRP